MRKFLSNIFIILSLLIVLNFVLYFGVIKPIFFKNYRINKNDISHYNTIILGDSHAEVLKHYPNDFGMFNFANLSENYMDMYLKLMYITSKLNKIDTIVINIDNHCLSTYRDGIGRLNENIVYAENDIGIKADYLTFELKTRKKLFFAPLLFPDLNIIITDFLKPKIFNLNTLKRKFSDFDNKTKCAKASKRYRQQYLNKRQSKEQLRYLKLIVDICENKGIILMGIRYPVSKEYSSLVKDKDFGIMNFWTSKGLRVLDFHDVFHERPDLFGDEDHLNDNGAALISREMHHAMRNMDTSKNHPRTKLKK